MHWVGGLCLGHFPPSFSSLLFFSPLILRPLPCAGGLCLAVTKSPGHPLCATLVMLTIRLHMTWLLTGEGIEICGGAGLMTVVRVGMTI